MRWIKRGGGSGGDGSSRRMSISISFDASTVNKKPESQRSVSFATKSGKKNGKDIEDEDVECSIRLFDKVEEKGDFWWTRTECESFALDAISIVEDFHANRVNDYVRHLGHLFSIYCIDGYCPASQSLEERHEMIEETVALIALHPQARGLESYIVNHPFVIREQHFNTVMKAQEELKSTKKKDQENPFHGMDSDEVVRKASLPASKGSRRLSMKIAEYDSQEAIEAIVKPWTTTDSKSNSKSNSNSDAPKSPIKRKVSRRNSTGEVRGASNNMSSPQRSSSCQFVADLKKEEQEFHLQKPLISPVTQSRRGSLSRSGSSRRRHHAASPVDYSPITPAAGTVSPDKSNSNNDSRTTTAQLPLLHVPDLCSSPDKEATPVRIGLARPSAVMPADTPSAPRKRISRRHSVCPTSSNRKMSRRRSVSRTSSDEMELDEKQHGRPTHVVVLPDTPTTPRGSKRRGPARNSSSSSSSPPPPPPPASSPSVRSPSPKRRTGGPPPSPGRPAPARIMRKSISSGLERNNSGSRHRRKSHTGSTTTSTTTKQKDVLDISRSSRTSATSVPSDIED